VTYLDMSQVEARQMTNAPPNRSRTGYGSKLPTHHMLKIAKRWHRVYCVCWSNAGTYYIRKGGKRIYIATGDLG